MKLSNKEIKQRYFDRVYSEAPVVSCLCGCGASIKSKDRYARDAKFINGHNGRKYDDPREYKRAWNHRNRKHRRLKKQQWIKSLKKDLILLAGAKCNLCGLDFDGECTAIFDFHHREPSLKRFALNNNSLNKYRKSRILEEAGKCDLLCANCHRLIHWDWETDNTAQPLGVIKG
jgi:hypothetical protein